MKNQRKFLLGLTLTTLFALSACSGGGSQDSFVGSWGSTEPEQPNLTISKTLEVTGTDGCNQVFGQAEIDGETLTFPDLAATQMFCEGVDDWLLGAASATVSKDSLVVLDSGGTEIGSLTKQ